MPSSLAVGNAKDPPRRAQRAPKADRVNFEMGVNTDRARPAHLSVQVHDDHDVENAGRHGYISGPCDCFVAIWALLGDAIEGGAEQLVGMALLPIVATVYYYSGIMSSAVGAAANYTAGVAEDPLDHIASAHPIYYIAVDLGGLLAISTVVLFEADLHRLYKDFKARARGYSSLHDAGVSGRFQIAASGVSQALTLTKPLRLMRHETLKRELHKAIDASEELERNREAHTAHTHSAHTQCTHTQWQPSPINAHMHPVDLRGLM